MSIGLKYRVWDIDDDSYITLDLDYYFIDLWGNLLEGKCDEEPRPFPHDVVIERDTGLKDKNGKEIYIGDIVSEHNGDIVGEITQKPSGEYCIAWIGIYAGSSVLYDELSMCEVIGNIHENQELLGGKDGARE